MKVWLTRKYAERIDGVDLRGREVGDTLELTHTDARALIAEEWAEPERREADRVTRHQRRRKDAL
jgi:hypothetical protein